MPSPWHSLASAGGGPLARLVSESLGNRPQTGVTSVRVLVISGKLWPLFLILSPNRKPVSQIVRILPALGPQQFTSWMVLTGHV